ncbi:V-type ATPase [Pisolithus albus]|nr:V-type ATPase [Pisolithus albus]
MHSYGTAKSGVGISTMSVLRPDLIMRCSVPIIMAGIIAIYGLVVLVIISGTHTVFSMPLTQGFIGLGVGLSMGHSGLSAGFAIGIVGDAGVRGTAQQLRLFISMILILIFAEVLGSSLTGLIVALIMHTKAGELVGLVSAERCLHRPSVALTLGVSPVAMNSTTILGCLSST